MDFCSALTLLFLTISREFCVSDSSSTPIVDLNKFLLGNEQQQQEVVDEVVSGLEGIGFVRFTNHGLPQSLIDAAFNISKQFFDQPLNYKRQYNKIFNADGSYKEFFGFTEIGGEIMGKTYDYKETYDTELGYLLNHYEMNDGFPPEFPIKIYTELALAMRQKILIMSQILSMALNGPRFYISNLVDQSQNGVLRFVHYPPTPQQNETFKSVSLAAHTDYYPTVVGFQNSNDNGAFEAWDKIQRTYVPVEYIPGTMAMNLGDVMQRWSNGRFLSNFHRMKSVKNHRYAMYLFMGPDWNHVVDPNDFINDNETEINYEPATISDIVRRRIEALLKDEENQTQEFGDPNAYQKDEL